MVSIIYKHNIEALIVTLVVLFFYKFSFLKYYHSLYKNKKSKTIKIIYYKINIIACNKSGIRWVQTHYNKIPAKTN
jgi:hypothetical protein